MYRCYNTLLISRQIDGAGGNVKFIIHEKVYSDGISQKKLKAIEKKIINGSVKLGVFLITLPLTEDGLLEIYWYPEFLQPVYKNLDCEVTVVGIAKSREDAFSLVERMVRDVGMQDGKLPIKNYFQMVKNELDV